MNFGDRWIRWKEYRISIDYSVLINASPQGYFKSHWGLRQGIPLSFYMFLLMTEILSRMLQKAEYLEWIRGLKCRKSEGEELTVSHILLYAMIL